VPTQLTLLALNRAGQVLCSDAPWRLGKLSGTGLDYDPTADRCWLALRPASAIALLAGAQAPQAQAPLIDATSW